MMKIVSFQIGTGPCTAPAAHFMRRWLKKCQMSRDYLATIAIDSLNKISYSPACSLAEH
jgi:hypothetical protein